METEEEQCMRILTNAVNECKSDWIALSGGLDSSILAHLRKDQKPQTMTIITKDFLGTDLTFAQIIAKHLGLNLSLIQVSMEDVLDSINETIKILGNYNDIEIRNSIVPYIYLTTLKKKGVDSVITGDGADEVFAGYNFLLKKSDEEIGEELKRIKKIMHFPSKDIARSLNMKVETPFLNEELIKFSDEIEISKKIYEFVGPICETGDTFARDRIFPMVNEKDLIAFRSCGAYGAVMASEYNSRPLIPEVLVKGAQFSIIRRRPSIMSIIERDIVPDWLS